MEILDKKNKKILYYLDINSREPYSQIAKKVGLSKNSVILRIKELENKGIIKGYYVYINNYKLGYQAIRVHYTFENTTPEIEKNIIDYLTDNKYTLLIARTYGDYNLSVIFMVKNIYNFYQIWQAINQRFGHYFKDKRISHYLKEYHFRLSYLYSDNDKSIINRKYDVCGGGDVIEIDQLDYKILQIMANDARIPLIKLSEILDKTTQTIAYRIKRLHKIGIIKRFGVLINLSIIGYKSYKAYLQLNDFTKKNDIINFAMKNKNLSYIDFTIGKSDIELDYHFRDDSEFFNAIGDISKKFPGAIRSYSSVTIPFLHKERLIPDYS